MGDTVLTAVDKKRKAAVMSLDLRKAFDTVDHNILLKKIEFLGIRSYSCNWFQDYLQNRK